MILHVFISTPSIQALALIVPEISPLRKGSRESLEKEAILAAKFENRHESLISKLETTGLSKVHSANWALLTVLQVNYNRLFSEHNI